MLNFSAQLTEHCIRSKSARTGDWELFFSHPKRNVSCLRRPGAVRAQPWCITKTISESENNNIEDSGLQHFNVNSTQRPVVEKFLS